LSCASRPGWEAQKKRTHEEPHTFPLAEQAPTDFREFQFARDEYFLLDARVIFKMENPTRPRLRGELLDVLRPAAADDIRCVLLRRQLEPTDGRFDPGVEAVHQHQSPGGRGGGGKQQRMLTARANAGRRAGSETAEAVGFKPFVIHALIRIHS